MDRRSQGLQLPLAVRLAGQAGLSFSQARNHIINAIGDTRPSYIVLHIGANDIGRVDQKMWLLELDELVCFLRAYCPKTTLIWSDMLPRTAWRYAHSLQGAENSRIRLNRKARARIFEESGMAIRYSNIDYSCLLSDGVHLTDRGNELFKANLEEQLVRIVYGLV